MKKTLTILLLTTSIAAANAAMTLVTFGNNGGKGDASFDASYLGQTASWNRCNTPNAGASTWNSLVDSEGNVSTIGIQVNGPVCGDGGMTNTIAGDTTSLSSIFGLDALTNANGGTANDGNSTSLTFSGLEIGKEYTFIVFTGRGNAYGNTYNCSYSFTSGADVISADIVSYYSYNSATPSETNNVITASTGSSGTANTNNNWMLAEFTFVATNTSAVFSTTGQTGNIAAFAIGESVVPEPASASLGLLGLSALLLRRRKA